MNRGIVFLLASTFILVSAITADAQEVRRYDDAGKPGANTAYYPGQPRPQAQTKEAASDVKGEAPKNFVTVFNGAVRAKRGKIDLAPDKMYRGIIPGTRDLMPHVERAKRASSSNVLTWVGFQPKKDGSARIFLQTASSADYSQSSDAKKIMITLSNTKIPLRNFSRFIDTRFFNNNVKRIESKQMGSDVLVTISLKESASPSVEKDGNYLYLNF